MRRILIITEYDGTPYCGWQWQHNGLSVQQVLTEAVEKTCGHKANLHGSGRTDLGVHALGQPVHFDTDCTIPAEKLREALNVNLPETVKVLQSMEVAPDFHARYSARSKTYLYKMYFARVLSPLKRLYSAQVTHKLDIKSMSLAANYLIGEHDFTSFKASGKAEKCAVRTVYDTAVYNEGEYVCFEITGSGFLHNMVRIIAGTLMEIGSGKLPPEHMQRVLDAKDRTAAGKTAPPQGLYLKKVDYGFNSQSVQKK